MPKQWVAKRNPPLPPPVDICPLCERRWPKEDMVEQRGVLICTRDTCLDQPDPKTGER